jgi:5-hydroxyisourate hydrolase
MSRISTHVLDAVLGRPAANLSVRLERRDATGWALIASSHTDADGRCRSLAADAPADAYRLTFETGAYLKGAGRNSIYPQISIVFECDGQANYHLPLLLSDNSYTTYRGS